MRTALAVLFLVTTAAKAGDVPTPGQASNAFGFDLYGKLRTQPGNICISPINVSSVLAMAAAGASGITLAQMIRVLQLESDEAIDQFADVLKQLQSGPNSPYELSLAAAIWGREGFPIQPAFVNRLGRGFGGGLRRVNLNDKSAALRIINGWVERETKDRIKDLLASQNIDADTRLILTSAIYFKGAWRWKFDKGATKDEAFWVGANKSPKTSLMHQEGDFNYFENDAMQMLEMPYKGNRLSMVVVLPRTKDGLDPLEPTLSAGALDSFRAKLRARRVDLTMPRFEFSERYQLPDLLKSLGMTRPFSNEAEFAGISTAEPLKISDVIHKVYVRVDEEGSEAAAATGGIIANAPSPVVEVIPFRADHPFLFIIRDSLTGSILFLGRFSEPGK